MKKINIAYIGGGSKDWAHKYFSDILSQDKLSGELRLYDTDMPSALRNKKYFDRLIKSDGAHVKSDWSCRVTAGIGDALAGADFVIISILPYTFNEMRVDVHYPEKYGIWQSVGDTTGAGGYSRALRTIPSYVFFAEKIREYCPEAWVINYTNPMAMCLNTLYAVFPEIKAFGCCHEVFGLQKLLANIMSMYLALSENGKKAFMNAELPAVLSELRSITKKSFSPTAVKKLKRTDIVTNVQGINHFTWINEAHYGDTDVLPVYRAFIKLSREYNKSRLGKLVPDAVKRRRNKENVKFTLFEKYGVCAGAGDRHLAEFVPDMFLTKKNVLPDGFRLTTVSERILNGNLLKILTRYYATPCAIVRIHKSDEEGLMQMAAVCGLGDMITNINMPNRGQAPNLVPGATVETNAKLSLNSVKPICAGDMTAETAELVNVHALNQKEFVDAYLAHDREKLCDVFCRDPAVARIGAQNGQKLFSEMIAENSHVLEKWLTD